MRELADGSKAVAIMSTREDIPIFMSISFDQVRKNRPFDLKKKNYFDIIQMKQLFGLLKSDAVY